MKRICILLFLFLFCWTACSADTLSDKDFCIEYTTPEGWYSSAQYSLAELESQMGLTKDSLKLISRPLGVTCLYYPVDGVYSPENAIQLTIKPMESYHQNYSGLNETQLGNIAASFIRDGKMDAYQVIQTAGGLTFLQLHHTGGQQGHTFTTNENGAVVRANVPASADAAQVLHWLDSISIRVQRNALLDLLIQCWYYPFVSAIIIACIILRNKKVKTGQ